jgi:hypothetical protein
MGCCSLVAALHRNKIGALMYQVSWVLNGQLRVVNYTNLLAAMAMADRLKSYNPHVYSVAAKTGTPVEKLH